MNQDNPIEMTSDGWVQFGFCSIREDQLIGIIDGVDLETGEALGKLKLLLANGHEVKLTGESADAFRAWATKRWGLKFGSRSEPT